MAPPVGTLRVGRYFVSLIAILALLYAIVFWPGQRNTPKLGLDLVGGTQVIFTAKTVDTGKTPPSSSMAQAKQIMENRVNGAGVSGAEVVIQGSNRIVISIPGGTDTDVAKLGQAAILNFRGIVMPPVPVTHPNVKPSTTANTSTTPTQSGSPSTTPAATTAPVVNAPVSSSGSPKNLVGLGPLAIPGRAPVTTAATAPTTPKASRAPRPTSTAHATTTPATTPVAAPPASKDPFSALRKQFAIPTSDTAFAKLTSAQRQELQTALTSFDCSSAQDEKDDPKAVFLGCDDSKTFGVQFAYLLGPVIVPGHEIKSAAAQVGSASQGTGGQWSVVLGLKSTGETSWAKYTGAHNIGGGTGSGLATCGAGGTPCADFVAFTLDGSVISSPVNESAINGGNTQITGHFTQRTAKQLSDQLKYGALPLSFKPENVEHVSATLGTSQLKAGLLAGGIGLILVVIYTLFYYRALGLVTIASLLVSGGLTYGALVVLGTQINFTLSLAGIAGFIVAVGITADSFVVFFERMKDEVHEGRSLRVAIPRAWVRARRTILSADTVSFLAAATLYYFAAGDVRGFAFTLGLSTVLDLVVVFLFTHPVVSWLSRKKAFGSARFTGLNAVRDGGVAVGPPDSPTRTRAKRARSGGPVHDTAGSATAVLDRDDAPAHDVAPDNHEPWLFEPTASPVPAPTDQHDLPSGNAIPVADPAVTPPSQARPEAGTAAERAAARRARMRAEEAEKGKH